MSEQVKLQSEPPFIVLHAARGSEGILGPREGYWYRRDQFDAPLPGETRTGTAYALPTGRVEHRDSDGASAEVFEVHPAGGNYDPAEWGLPE